MVREELVYAAQLLALTGLALAQPLLDVFGRNPAEFLFRQVSTVDMVQFGVLVVFVPPAVLWLVGIPWRLVGPGARLIAHLVEVFAVTALLVLAALGEWSSAGLVPAVLVGLVGGTALVISYLRFPAIRTWLAYLAVAPLVFLALFLSTSPSSDLVFGGEVDASEAATADDRTDLPSVVYVVLDELPLGSLVGEDGQIDDELFPNLAQLAADGAWFDNTTAVSSATWYAAPPLLTGNFPRQDDSPTANDQPDNLFTALRDLYDVRAHEALTKLCPPGNCGGDGGSESDGGSKTSAGGLGWLLRDAADVYRTLVVPGSGDVDATTTLAEVRADVEQIDDGNDGDGEQSDTTTSTPERVDADSLFDVFDESQPVRYTEFVEGLDRDTNGVPTFDYLQILIPHERWVSLPSGLQYPVPEHDVGRIEGEWAEVPPAIDVVRQRHLLQTAYADRLVGGIVDRLKELGTYDDTILVVTSDHGVAFEPGETVRAVDIGVDAEPVLPELMWVPLVVKAPEFEPGTVRSDNVLAVDIAPTIADLIGVELGWVPDGDSVVDGPVRDTAEKPFYQAEISGFGFFLEPPVAIDEKRRVEVLDDSVGVRYPPGSQDRLYRSGEFGDLVGTPIDALGHLPAHSAQVVVDELSAFEDVDKRSQAPALVNGRVLGAEDGAEPLWVAVVLDGRIAFVGRSFGWEGEAAVFTGVIPERLFEDGENTLRVFQVLGTPEDPRLAEYTVVAS